MDFVVIDIEEDKQVSLLLGRPFLAIGAALMEVKKEELTLSVTPQTFFFYEFFFHGILRKYIQ